MAQDMQKLVESGDLEGIKRAVQDDPAKLDAPLQGGKTPLMVSCCQDTSQPAIVRWLIDEGADLDITDDLGGTALHYACQFAQADTVEELIEGYASLDVQFNEGWTALMMACRQGLPDVARALLQNGAQVNLQNHEGNTALMIACRLNVPDTAEVLIENDAILDMQNHEGWTALMIACRLDVPNAAEALIKAGASLDMLNNKGWTALMYACYDGQFRTARALIEDGASLDLQSNVQGWTALMIASIFGKPDTVKALMERGASLNLRSINGATTLMHACRYGHAATVKVLIKSAELNVQDTEGRSALMLACCRGKPDTAKPLIGSGAELNMQDNKGMTALMLACRHGHPDTVEALIEARASLDLQDTNKRWTALIHACYLDRVDTVRALIENNANLNLQSNRGGTALMVACTFGHPETVQALIDRGAYLNLQTDSGATALMHACRQPRESRRTVEELMSSAKLCYAGGADLTLTNRKGNHALAIARSEKRADAVAFLEFVTTSRVARILLDELQVPRSEVVAIYDNFLSEEIEFSGTKIGDAGARALAVAIADDNVLARLDLSNGQVGDAGAEALAMVLGMNEALIELDLRDNAISYAGARALTDAMAKGSCLQKIWLNITTISRIPKCELIHRRHLKSIIDADHNHTVIAPDPDEITMATLDALAIAAEKARAISTRYHDYFDEALREIASILAGLNDPLDAFRPFEDQMQAIRQHVEAFESVQKAVVADRSLAPSRNEKRSEILEHIRRVLAEGLDGEVAKLAACASQNDIQSACERAWTVFIAAPLSYPEQCPTFQVLKSGGQVLEDARRAWRARHDFTSLQRQTNAAIDALDAQMMALAHGTSSCLSLRNPAQVQELTTEMCAVEQAFRAELDALRTDDAMLDAPFDEIRTALTQLAAFYALVVPREASRWCDNVVFATAQLAHLSQGSTEPDIDSLEQELQSVRIARRTQERLKLELGYARDDIKSGDSDAADAVARLEAQLAGMNGIFKLDRKVRRTRADVLRHAETHYPELLNDDEWCRRIGITDGALVGVGKLSLWLGDVTEHDFDVVQELTSRMGKTTKRVRDPDGRDLVLKRFHLGSKALYSHFYRQVQALAEIDSAFVTRIEGLFTENSLFGCILMPFYPGGDLDTWIRNNPYANAETRKRIAVGILTGVHAVHQRNLVHCDIKPENIFLTWGLSPVLGDFDGVQHSEVTVTRPLQTTIKYVAPELRDGNVDRVVSAADMYSVGVVLKELFPDLTSSLKTLLWSLSADDPAQRPSALEALHHKAFHSEPVHVESCVICLEIHPATKGASCFEGHFTCNNCLSSSMRAACQPNAHVRVLRDGSMRCVSPDCEHLVAGNALAAAVPKEDFSALLRIVREHFERDTALEQEREVRCRVDAALREHGLDPETQNHLRVIQGEVLTMMCPRCSTAFADFDGCCALKCGACPCYFCAWCVQDAGNDWAACHTHVARCDAKPASECDPFYSDFDVVQQAWADIRAQRLRAYFADKIADADVRAKVREKLMPLLTPDIVGEDFGI